MQDRTGTTIGRYHITALLGQGAMAQVYRANHPVLDRDVAIKIMLSHLASRPGFAEQFVREARAVARLRHPNIVQIYDFDVADGLYYMVMEFVVGHTLTTELEERAQRNQPYTLEEIACLFDSLASAVDYAHRRGIIHRDLKPDNAMFTIEGQIVLTDFGIALLKGDRSDSDADTFTAGSPAYVSPEQALGDPLDGRSDIYTLGVMLYEMTTGQRPFLGSSATEVMVQHVNDLPPLPSSINPSLPEAVETVLLTALKKNPDERYQTAQEMSHAFRRAVGISDDQVPVGQIVSTIGERTDGQPVVRRAEPGDIPPCPYRGLFAFNETDAPFFFGREDVTDHLVDMVEQQSSVAIIGPSGSGKSSVVLAGLLPALRQCANVRQVQGTAWAISHMRPGRRPFQTLAAALVPLLKPDLRGAAHMSEVRAYTQSLEEGDTTIAEVVEKSIHRQQHAQRLLLIIDQFEELYTLGTDAPMHQRFLDGLLEAIQKSPLTLIFTLRADFVGQAVSYRPVADLLQAHAFILGPMNRHELSQAIVNPAQKVGVAFEAGLVERILDDVGNEPGNLPLLEFALSLLWEEQQNRILTHAAYEAIGTVEGALARYADSVYTQFVPEQQVQARHVFIQLVRPGEGTEDTRRVAGRGEFCNEDWLLVQHLADARLVVTSRDAEEQETVEVVHEALIRKWDRVRDWMNQDRTFRAWQERLRAALSQWETSNRDEGGLLRGAPLVEAEAWMQERPLQVGERERAYIQTSSALREREQQNRERLRQLIMTGALGATMVLTVLLILTALQWQRALSAQDMAATERERAKESAAEARGLLLASDVQRMIDQQAPNQALALMLASIEGGQHVPKAQSLLSAAAYASARQSFTGHTDAVNGVTFSPDGGTVLSASSDTTLRLWDVATGQQLRTFVGHTSVVWKAVFRPDGKVIASSSDDTTIRLWDAATGQQIGILQGHTARVLSVAFSPDGKTLLSGSGDKTMRLWDVASGKEVRRFLGHTEDVVWVAFNPAGNTAVSSSVDGTIRLWDVDSGKEVRRFEGHTDIVWAAVFSPDGRRILSGSADSTVRLWDVQSGEQLRVFYLGYWVYSVAIHPTGQFAVAGTWNKTVHLLDLENGKQMNYRSAHTGLVMSVAFSPNGAHMLSGSLDKTMRLWDVDSGAQLEGFSDSKEWTTGVAFNPADTTVVYGSFDSLVRLWDPQQNRLVRTFAGHTAEVACVDFNPQGHTFISGSFDKTIRLWDVDSGKEVRQFAGHTGRVIDVAFHPDGQTFISGSLDKTMRLWNVASGKEVRRFEGHAGGVTAVAFSPDGRTALSGSADSTVRLWDVDGGKELHRFEGHGGTVWGVAFSPDGRTATSASEDNTVRLWDLEHLTLIQILTGHTQWVTSVTFSPDGKTILSGSGDGTLRLWDATTGDELRRFEGHTDVVRNVAFRADGRMALSGSFDSSVRLWRIDTLEELITWTRNNRYIPELTCEERERYGLQPLCTEPEGQEDGL